MGQQALKLGLITKILIRFFLHAALLDDVRTETGRREDVCQFETFQPRCPKNEAILMQSATYGRMRIGRCITAEEVAAQRSLAGDVPRSLGCSENVLGILDATCSGKIECEIRVNDISDENIQPCFPGLKMYLEIDYSCISVVDEQRSCAVTASANPVHIVSPSGSQEICGTKSQPWLLEAPVGQKLRLSVFFLDAPSVGDSCHSLGVIVDKVRKRNVSVCVGGGQRETELYLSSGNTLELYLSLTNRGQERDVKRTSVIFKIEAVGCSDIIPPEDTWLKRHDDTIQIGCYSSRQTWQLTCKGGTWAGVLGNCTHEMPLRMLETETEIASSSLSSSGQVLAIIAICGFTLAICLTIICVGGLSLRRYHSKRRKRQDVYKTIDNSARSQQRIMTTNGDVIADMTGSTIHGLSSQPVPTNYVQEENDNYSTSVTQST